jgi:hypothetical protein
VQRLRKCIIDAEFARAAADGIGIGFIHIARYIIYRLEKSRCFLG